MRALRSARLSESTNPLTAGPHLNDPLDRAPFQVRTSELRTLCCGVTPFAVGQAFYFVFYGNAPEPHSLAYLVSRYSARHVTIGGGRLMRIGSLEVLFIRQNRCPEFALQRTAARRS